MTEIPNSDPWSAKCCSNSFGRKPFVFGTKGNCRILSRLLSISGYQSIYRLFRNILANKFSHTEPADKAELSAPGWLAIRRSFPIVNPSPLLGQILQKPALKALDDLKPAQKMTWVQWSKLHATHTSCRTSSRGPAH